MKTWRCGSGRGPHPPADFETGSLLAGWRLASGTPRRTQTDLRAANRPTSLALVGRQKPHLLTCLHTPYLTNQAHFPRLKVPVPDPLACTLEPNCLAFVHSLTIFVFHPFPPKRRAPCLQQPPPGLRAQCLQQPPPGRPQEPAPTGSATNYQHPATPLRPHDHITDSTLLTLSLSFTHYLMHFLYNL